MDKKIFKIYKLLNESIDKTEKNPLKLIQIVIGKINSDIKLKWWTTKFVIPKKSKWFSKQFKTNSVKLILYKANHSIDNMFDWFFHPDLLWWDKLNKSEDVFACFFIIWNNIYLITSSHSFAYFLAFIDDDFSLKIASKIITWKIKYEKSVNITWDTLTSDLIYRDLKWFSKFDNLWKVVKWFVGELNKTKSKRIVDLLIPDNKKYYCEIWNSFSLRKSLNFDETLRLVSDLDILFEEEEKSDDYKDFQMLEKINPRFIESKKLIPKLKESLIDLIYEFYLDDKKNILDCFEMVHPTEFIKFIECTTFKLWYSWDEILIDWILNLKDIIKFVKSKKNNLTKEDLLSALEEDISIHWINSDDLIEIESEKKSILNYIICEFKYNNNIYFLINWSFYFVKSDFIDILNNDLSDELTRKDMYLEDSINSKLHKWDLSSVDQDTEHKYNKLYLNNKNFIVLDKVFYKWIEFCDLNFIDGINTYLLHVKKWFDWDMRILSEQILISSITLSEYKKMWNFQVIKDYYKSLKKKKWTKSMDDIWKQSDIVKEKDFLDLFATDKTLNFVLAFTYSEDLLSIFKTLDRSKISSKLSNLSIIAKYELLVLIKNMRAVWINFYITQIKTV